ncbi:MULTISPECIES: ATP-binding cassette domain-containing protein [Anaerolinea]|uniref:ABC transporter ATP-binding protein n=1 Tax=Anaerolinea TaxID=233189 RepID=UPI0026112FE4|nr:ATP-binding cassette domain-containing protein [Anaerolinea thermophila]
MEEPSAIRTEHLGRVYKIRNNRKEAFRELVALQDVNLEVQRGELFGLLGPNGAGKTTLIKILTTLLAPTSGKASVAGYDVLTQAGEVRKRINMVSGGETSGYGLLTVRENLWMFAQFYGIESKEAYRRIDMLMEIVGMKDRLNTKSADLSTGLRQKMNIVRGFLTDPEVLFLDEPTLGLDVGASRDVRAFIRRWMDENPQRTLLLTTHYMVEAEELCDRVAIINQGRVLACDTPGNLKQQLQHEAIFQVWVQRENLLEEQAFKTLGGLRHFHQTFENGALRLELILDEENLLTAVLNRLVESQARILRLEKRQPTLEDVFVHLVGQRLEEVEGESHAPAD